jgi:HPt (histidine-containing phosphotransfer) domain-containing protein
LINRVTKHTTTCGSAVEAAIAIAAPLENIEELELPRSLVNPLAYEMLEQNLGKDASLDILRVFLGSTAELVVELQTSIRIQNCKEASIALHELKSSCTIVGANGVLEQCFKMEELLQKTDWNALERSMTELVRETRLVGQFINELLSQALLGHFSR